MLSYSSPRVTVSHTLMIHMEFMCLFMLSFIWRRGGWRKEVVYSIFLNTSDFWKRKKKEHPEHYPYLIRSNHYTIIHINSVSYNSLILIGTSSFFPLCSKRKEECSFLFEREKGKGLFSDEIYTKISAFDVAPGVTWCLYTRSWTFL